MPAVIRLPVLLLILIVCPCVRAQVNMETYVEDTETGFVLYVDNLEYVPITVDFHLELKNAEADKGADFYHVVPAREVRYAVDTIRVTDLYTRSGVAAATRSILGDFTVTSYDTNHVYTLPYKIGTTHRVFQGYNGRFTHQNELALDFDLKIGTPVYAARGGIVADVVEHNDTSCVDSPDCFDLNNLISIYHDDETFANYAHLEFQGAEVMEGDTVRQGQLIGYSGKTGFTNGPHLHFVVSVPRDGRWETIPTLFATGNGERKEILREGVSYTRKYGQPPQN